MGLQATDPERADENAGLIAQHFERAGDAMKAAEWHLRAIGWAGLRDPMASIRHALQIVDLDDDIPNDADGDMVRLSARLYVTTMGWRVGADPAVTGRPSTRASSSPNGPATRWCSPSSTPPSPRAR